MAHTRGTFAGLSRAYRLAPSHTGSDARSNRLPTPSQLADSTPCFVPQALFQGRVVRVGGGQPIVRDIYRYISDRYRCVRTRVHYIFVTGLRGFEHRGTVCVACASVDGVAVMLNRLNHVLIHPSISIRSCDRRFYVSMCRFYCRSCDDRVYSRRTIIYANINFKLTCNDKIICIV